MNIATEWKERFRVVRMRLDLDQDGMGRRLGVSREWVSKLERGREEPSELLQIKLQKIEAELHIHKEESRFTPPHLKAGHKRAAVAEDQTAYSGAVASRIPLDKRQPSTRAECEAYFATLMEAAEVSGNPNAWPVIHDRLQKKFPLAEWKEEAE